MPYWFELKRAQQGQIYVIKTETGPLETSNTLRLASLPKLDTKKWTLRTSVGLWELESAFCDSVHVFRWKHRHYVFVTKKKSPFTRHLFMKCPSQAS